MHASGADRGEVHYGPPPPGFVDDPWPDHAVLTVTSPTSALGTASLLGLVAVLAINRPVATRLEGYCGLLPTPGTNDRCALRFAPGVSSPSSLFVLLCLAARPATLWS